MVRYPNPPPGFIFSLAGIFAGAFIAILCGNSLLDLALTRQMVFPLTESPGFGPVPPMAYSDDPISTVVVAAVTVVVGLVGLWLFVVCLIGIWRNIQS